MCISIDATKDEATVVRNCCERCKNVRCGTKSHEEQKEKSQQKTKELKPSVAEHVQN